MTHHALVSSEKRGAETVSNAPTPALQGDSGSSMFCAKRSRSGVDCPKFSHMRTAWCSSTVWTVLNRVRSQFRVMGKRMRLAVAISWLALVTPWPPCLFALLSPMQTWRNVPSGARRFARRRLVNGSQFFWFGVRLRGQFKKAAPDARRCSCRREGRRI